MKRLLSSIRERGSQGDRMDKSHREKQRESARSLDQFSVRRRLLPISIFVAMPLLALVAIDDSSMPGPVLQVEALAITAAMAYAMFRARQTPDLSRLSLVKPLPVTPSEADINEAMGFVAR